MRQKKKSYKSLYEVYICKDEKGDTLYIGSGVTGRHQHCDSGVSNVYELNELHFQGAKLSVNIVDLFETKEESLAKEKDLILKFRPRFNKQYLTNTKSISMRDGVRLTNEFRKIVEAMCKKYYKSMRCTPVVRLLDYVEQLIVSYKINGLIKGVQVTGVLGFHKKGQLGKKYCNKTGSCTHKIFEELFERNGSVLAIRQEHVVTIKNYNKR